jgi:hypothetical protein
MAPLSHGHAAACHMADPASGHSQAGRLAA